MKIFSVYFIFLICGYVTAMSDYEVAMMFAKQLLVCAKENPVDVTELIKLQKLEIPTKTDTKCLLACVYRGFKTLKSDGTFDLEASYKLSEEAKKGDEKAIENAKKLADICIKVNDAQVSDGGKGCDRSALMFECVVNNAPKLGFQILFDFEKMALF